jgi:hypothetical protein
MAVRAPTPAFLVAGVLFALPLTAGSGVFVAEMLNPNTAEYIDYSSETETKIKTEPMVEASCMYLRVGRPTKEMHLAGNYQERTPITASLILEECAANLSQITEPTSISISLRIDGKTLYSASDTYSGREIADIAQNARQGAAVARGDIPPEMMPRITYAEYKLPG